MVGVGEVEPAPRQAPNSRLLPEPERSQGGELVSRGEEPPKPSVRSHEDVGHPIRIPVRLRYGILDSPDRDAEVVPHQAAQQTLQPDS
jgi:hypothetical protein